MEIRGYRKNGAKNIQGCTSWCIPVKLLGKIMFPYFQHDGP